MRYLERRPGGRLSRWIECIWFLRGSHATAGRDAQRIAPDGCMEIVIHLEGSVHQQREDGRTTEQPRQILVGQMDRPLLLHPPGTVDMTGIRFHPAGARVLFPFPLHEIGNEILDLREVHPRLSRSLRNSLADHQDLTLRFGAVEAALERSIPPDAEGDLLLEAAVTKLLRAQGRLSIHALSTQLGISSRQLERKFMAGVGLPPKLFSSILRFQSVFQAVQCGDHRVWADVAADCGYFDQAHFTREFKRFSGQNPPAFFEDENLLARLFTRERRMSHSYKTARGPSAYPAV